MVQGHGRGNAVVKGHGHHHEIGTETEELVGPASGAMLIGESDILIIHMVNCSSYFY